MTPVSARVTAWVEELTERYADLPAVCDHCHHAAWAHRDGSYECQHKAIAGPFCRCAHYKTDPVPGLLAVVRGVAELAEELDERHAPYCCTVECPEPGGRHGDPTDPVCIEELVGIFGENPPPLREHRTLPCPGECTCPTGPQVARLSSLLADAAPDTEKAWCRCRAATGPSSGTGDDGLREEIARSLHEPFGAGNAYWAERAADALLAGPLRRLLDTAAALERAAKLADAWIDYEETEADPLSHHGLIAAAGRDLRRALDPQ